MNLISLILFASLNFHQLIKPEEIFKISQCERLVTIMPQKDTLPEDSTLIYLGYTRDELVIYAKMWQKDKINATARKRDAQVLAQSSEDAINIMLTTQKERNFAYFITVNPLGTILDKIISPSGVMEWDADIKVKTEMKKNFCSALILIPFKDLSFSESKWGIQIWRIIIGKLEIQALKPTTNLSSPKEVLDFEIDFKYIKKQREYALFFIPSFRIEKIPDEKVGHFEGGFTLRFKKGTSELFDLTYKPDFSEVDVDILEASVTRLPVDYPEKRPFFVDGFSIITSPITLVRTRNITYPNIGIKFCSIREKSSFSAWYINDDSLENIAFARFTYSPFEEINLGVFLNTNRMGYNLISADLTYYFTKFKTNLSFQYSKRLDFISNLFDLKITKEVVKGLNYRISYTEIDSSFISPLNFINLYFDGIKEGNVYLSYKNFYKEKFYLVFAPYFGSLNSKYGNSLITQEMGINFVFGLPPYFLTLNYSNSKLGYLREFVEAGLVKDINTNLLTLAFLYQVSGWKQITLSYTFGHYLGGRLNMPYFTLKFNVKGLNLGTNYFYFKSPIDDYYLLQVFGEIPLIMKNLVFKPYFGYKYDNSVSRDEITFNGIFAYQPSAFSGIFFAINKSLTKNGDDYINKNEKEVFKIQMGIDILR